MSGNTKKKAVLLLSGGLDSTTVLEIAKAQGFDVYALSFSYGQRHSIELEAVQRILAKSPVQQYKVVQMDLRAFGGSALTADIDVPKNDELPADSAEIPVTYVPARNTIFLSFAVGYAETIGAYDIFLGVNAIDYSNYPDCRPEFIECFERLANLATAAGVRNKRSFKIHAPLIHMTKAAIIKTGLALGVDYSVTNSCYDPTVLGEACGRCDACHLRIRGFQENGLSDPAPYIKK
jgi:7-cyano-7-deazaguanine synthase